MRLDGERESENIEDRRGGGGFGGGGGLPIGIAGGGIGTVVLVVLALLLGVDPREILQGGGGDIATEQQAPPAGGQDTGEATDDARRFVGRILASTEDVWTAVFRDIGRRYDPPKLVLFSGAVRSGCGVAGTAVGPFYCPADQQVYIDLAFFRDMERKLGAPGDFARAYVIAHEVGHHVQAGLGIAQKVEAARQQAGEAESNALSVRLELQADCFAGVWARRAQESRNILENGDIEQGLNAAAAVGDDRLQRRARGEVVPESFTHGSSAQRVRWFRTGLASDDIRACDTFDSNRS
jgi:predicted metalloprotease